VEWDNPVFDFWDGMGWLCFCLVDEGWDGPILYLDKEINMNRMDVRFDTLKKQVTVGPTLF
jgi:hypothetical protein